MRKLDVNMHHAMARGRATLIHRSMPIYNRTGKNKVLIFFFFCLYARKTKQCFEDCEANTKVSYYTGISMESLESQLSEYISGLANIEE